LDLSDFLKELRLAAVVPTTPGFAHQFQQLGDVDRNPPHADKI
jgi:hypothetical protein